MKTTREDVQPSMRRGTSLSALVASPLDADAQDDMPRRVLSSPGAVAGESGPSGRDRGACYIFVSLGISRSVSLKC